MGATNDLTVYWTAEDYAADGDTYDFQNPTGNNWRNVSDDSAAGAGVYPGATGCTLSFLDSTAGLPDTNLPDAGEVFAVVIGPDSQELGMDERDLTEYLGAGDWTFSSLTALGGDVAFTYLDLTTDGAEGSTVAAGLRSNVYLTGPGSSFANATMTALAGGCIEPEALGVVTLAQKLTIAASGSLTLTNATTLVANGGIDFAGTLQFGLGDASSIDVASPILITGDCAFDWNSDTNAGSITGGLNADGNTVTHTNTAGATLTCDVTGTLDLGGAATGLAINIEGTGITVTAGDDISCGTLTLTEGTYVAAVTHTVATSQVLTVADSSTLTLTDAGLNVRVTGGTCTLGGDLSCKTLRVESGATLDADSNGLTLASGRIHGYGTLTNLVPAGVIHVAPGIIDGGGNHANVIFDPVRLPLVV